MIELVHKEVFAFGILHRPEKRHKYSNARNIYAVLTRFEIEKDFQSNVLQISIIQNHANELELH